MFLSNPFHQSLKVFSPLQTCSDYDAIDINPFVIRPAEFQLQSGDSIDLEVLFTPEGSEEYKRKFVMVCDNCQVKIFTISGIGCNVEVEISAIDDRPIQYGAEKLVRPSHMCFRGLTPNATITRRLSVQNVTPLELNFQWLVKAPKENRISKHFDVSGAENAPHLGSSFVSQDLPCNCFLIDPTCYGKVAGERDDDL